MQRPVFSRILKSMLVCAATAASPIIGIYVAWADTKPNAVVAESGDPTSKLMERGFAELKRGDLEAARDAFAAAWGHRPDVIVALSLAEVEMRLGRFTDAAEHWQFLVLNLPPTASGQRDAAREQLELCRTHVGAVTVQVAPDGSSVVVDDKPVGESPLGRELFLAPGEHSVSAIHDGRRSIARTFQVSAGGRLSFTLAVPDAAEINEAPAESQPAASAVRETHEVNAAVPTEHSSGSARTPLLIVGGATALAAGALGTYFVIRSNKASDTATSARRAVDEQSKPGVPSMSRCAGPDIPEACSALATSVADVDRFRNLAIASFLGAGVLAAGTIGLAVLWKGEGSEHAKANAAHVVVSPSVGSLNGLQVSGTF